jgi:hypothetical protein
MAERVVDVFLDDEFLVSYPIMLNSNDVPVKDWQFIERARQSMGEDGHSSIAIELATFKVRGTQSRTNQGLVNRVPKSQGR